MELKNNFSNLKKFKLTVFWGASSIRNYEILFIPLFVLIFFPLTSFSQQISVDLGVDDWHRVDRHDGYVTGNGHIYMVGALGQKITRTGKSFLRQEPVSLTRIAWVNGPTYSVGNLGFGWELIPEIDGETTDWDSESVLSPSPNQPFWRVHSETQTIRTELTDIIVGNHPVLMRRVKIIYADNAPGKRVRIFIPVHADPRNSPPFEMWNGEPVEEQRLSVNDNELLKLHSEKNALILRGAPRALWQEISTPIPSEKDYKNIFPPRALATTITTDSGITFQATESGFQIDLGVMQPGTQKEFGVWLVTATGTEETIEANILDQLSVWSQKDINQVTEMSRSALPAPLIQRVDKKQDPFTTIIESTSSLVRATQAASGCVLAQPYMYPMCYIRDQIGSFKTFLAQAEYERAYRALTFYIAMQNRYGIQNAYDTPPSPPDPTIWKKDANSKDGHHSIAEVPSIIILMAKDYYNATGALYKIKPLYERLAYNLRVQERSKNNLLPSPGDESYTNSEQTAPKYRVEMTDSNLLFISAARFMAHLADTLGNEEDADEFKELEKMTENALMKRLWVDDGNYFAYARSTTDNPDEIDKRPALDILLRWFWLEMSNPLDTIPQQNLATALGQLTNPVRVVPEVYDFTAGMDLGYLLYALSRSQNPVMHKAAELMVNYASDSGLFAEYYEHEKGTIIPFSGTLRPWESGINAAAMAQYLLGLQPDMPNQTITLQPHLPPGWKGWRTRPIELYSEGTIEISMMRDNKNNITFKIHRKGGKNPINVNLSLGGYGVPINSDAEEVNSVNKRTDILKGSFILKEAGEDSPTTKEIQINLSKTSN